MGTAGEFAMMSEQERMRAAEIVVGTAERLEIIINAGWASTRESIKMARFIKDIGADCAIAVAPYFYHPTVEGIAKHYLDIADQADFPVMAYNIPSFAGNRMPVDILGLFEKDERVVGIKDSEGDAAKLQAFIERAAGDFAVMVGMDSLVSFGISQGAKGMMVGSAAIAPAVCVEMYGALLDGNYGRAFMLQKRLNHFIEAMQIGTFPAGIKYALSLQGLSVGHVRTPLQDLDEGQKRLAQDHLKLAWPEEKHRAVMADKDFRYLIADEEGGPVGFAILHSTWLRPQNLYLKRIAVHDAEKGAGKRILAALHEWVFTTTDTERFWLEVVEHNRRAQHVYRSTGWIEEGIVRDAYFDDARGARGSFVQMSILKSDWQRGSGLADGA